MHLVFVTSIVPGGDPTSGYEIANAAILDSLRRNGVRVTALGFAWPGRVPADRDGLAVLGEVEVRNDRASRWRKGEWLATALVNGLTVSSAKMRAASPAEVGAALAALAPVDGYVLNSVQFAGAFPGLFSDRPSLYVAHNVEAVSARQNAEAAGGAVERLLFAREARLVERIEARLCRDAAFVFTLAEEDRAALGVADDARSAALPLITRDVLAAPAPRTVGFDVAMIGTWTWAPNRIGLDWFLSRVVPLLPAGLDIRIAGATPEGLVVPEGVRLVGRVPDAADFLREAGVVALASTAGTGVQLKTIETFELGLPAVATAHSLRGIAERPDNCIVADTPEAFAAALVGQAARRAPARDGRDFHDRQRAALDTGVRRGLDALLAAKARWAA